ncbi:MAG TPA: response regulator, partial [Proteobacteria bacterium]|nr:response regulator [Pseudomonadota bacterium]
MATDLTKDKPKLLIVEDDDDLRTQMKWGLAKDYQVLEAMDKKSALQAMAEGAPQVATLDLGLPPDQDGISEGFGTLSKILEADPGAKVTIITGRDERKNALKALEFGAYDFLAKPVNLDDLRIILQRAFYISNLERDYRELKSRAGTEPFESMLGTSPQISNVYEKIRKVAPTGVPVM